MSKVIREDQLGYIIQELQQRIIALENINARDRPTEFTTVSLVSSTSYSIVIPTGYTVLELELGGSHASPGGNAWYMVQPTGPGTSLNGRNVRYTSTINTVEGVSSGVNNDANTRDLGFSLAVTNNTNPCGIFATGVFDFGNGISHAVSARKDRSTTNSSMDRDHWSGFLYGAPQTPTGVTINFISGAGGTLTGTLRYKFRV